MWRVAIEYPNGDKILIANDFRHKLSAKWREAIVKEEMNEGQKNHLLIEAYDGMTKFDFHKGVSKQWT